MINRRNFKSMTLTFCEETKIVKRRVSISTKFTFNVKIHVPLLRKFDSINLIRVNRSLKIMKIIKFIQSAESVLCRFVVICCDFRISDLITDSQPFLQLGF